MSKQSKSKHKYSLMERIAIFSCMLVSVIAMIIMIFVYDTRQELKASALGIETTHQEDFVPEETTAIEETTPVILDMQKETTESTQQAQETLTVENLQENLTEWFLSNENTDVITIWKKSTSDGALLIAIVKGEETLVTFKYEQEKYEWLTNTYNEWTLCDDVFGETSIRDIIDYGFVAYHEVGGRNPANVQAQVSVVGNREKCEYFPNTTREVIVAQAQYNSAPPVVARRLKDYDETAEKEDLEKCFRQVLLVLAGEVIEVVPENVVFAAGGPQGSGVWKVIDGTYYCYIDY